MRTGAGAAMVGAVLAVVFNLLHPRTDELTAAASAQAAAEEGIWALDHYVLAWTLAFALLAFIVISRSLSGEPSKSWGRVALWFGIGSTAIAFAAIAVDGFALRVAAESGSAEVAEAVAYVGEGLFVGLMASFFGVTPVLYGVAVLTGDDYPTWLGWVAVLAGLLGLVTSTIIFFDGFSDTTVYVLFPIASLLATLWIGVMGWLLWNKLRTPAAPAAGQPSG